jgi:hypothetical protein
MSSLAIALAAAQAFSVTIPAQSTIINDGERVELPTCTTVVNNGVLVLLMPDGARFVDDARSQSTATVVVDAVPATTGSAQVRAAYEADTAHGRMADIKVTYSTRRGPRTIASLSMPLRSSSDMLSGSWRRNVRSSDPADTYLDGETISLTVQGDAPVVRYTRGDMVANRRGRLVPARWSVETPIRLDGGTRASSSVVYVGGYYRRVRLEVTVADR